MNQKTLLPVMVSNFYCENELKRSRRNKTSLLKLSSSLQLSQEISSKIFSIGFCSIFGRTEGTCKVIMSSASPDANRIGRRVTTDGDDPRKRKNYQNFKPKSFVQRMPFFKRHKLALIFGGAFLSFCITYSAPIYYFFRTPPEHVDQKSLMWPGEKMRGKTYAEQYRERILKQRQQKAEREERLKAKQGAENSSTA